ncbi:galectin-9-like [Corythoichthys intestinalis]|uniref:galectin-9-like n=1 Tax=Corythoichthys intestinalis TaxID=161448 RepID=UPI0025A4F5D2|nr:galectin-9-like [Corythoichthys intestinalis]
MAFPQNTIYNPRIPFIGPINGGIQEGTSITITGVVQHGVERFHVNLQCGSNPNADVALHFNPRYDICPSYVVTNTFQHGCWGSEERKKNSPLATGTDFKLLITVSKDFYQLYVNGSHFMEYRHRIPFSRVNTISIAGKVDISSITFTNSMFSGQPGFPGQPGFLPQPGFPPYVTYPNQAMFPPCPGFPSQPGFAPPVYAVPYKAFLSGGVLPGRTITIQGAVHPNATRFHININHPTGIALHYNPRLNENIVVRNTKQAEKWGSEERDGLMPFSKGQPFTLKIYCESHSFRIMANGMHVHDYKHRFTQLNRISELEIDGDITITSVNV